MTKAKTKPIILKAVAPGIALLEDDTGGMRWWCARCGAMSAGHYLAGTPEAEMARMANNHNERRHGDSKANNKPR